MKKVLLLLAVTLPLLFVGCSKDDDNEIQTIDVNSIDITFPNDNQKIGVGQLVIASIDVKNNKSLTYNWSDEYGFISDKDTLNWIPTKKGTQTLKLELKNKTTTKTITKNVQVFECDYRLCFWGQDMFDIMIDEAANVAKLHNTTNKPITSYLPSYIVYTDLDDATIGHAYMLDSDFKVYGGLDMFTKTYPSTQYNNYLSDYDNERNKLIAKYGTPITNDTIWNRLVGNSPAYFGTNLVNGNVELKATWENESTKIVLQIKKGTSSGTVSFNTGYQKK
jgi:hypothetical protein